jgi:hypothetical protein
MDIFSRKSRCDVAFHERVAFFKAGERGQILLDLISFVISTVPLVHAFAVIRQASAGRPAHRPYLDMQLMRQLIAASWYFIRRDVVCSGLADSVSFPVLWLVV